MSLPYGHTELSTEQLATLIPEQPVEFLAQEVEEHKTDDRVEWRDSDIILDLLMDTLHQASPGMPPYLKLAASCEELMQYWADTINHQHQLALTAQSFIRGYTPYHLSLILEAQLKLYRS